MKKLKIKIINGTIIQGVGDVRPGVVIMVDPGIARQLFIAGKAVPYAGKPSKPVTRKVKGKK